MTISYSGDFVTLLGRWKGSVWKAVWKEALIWLSLYYFIRLTCILCLNDSQLEEMKKYVRMFDSFTGKIPLQFLLGFYVGQVVTRWWAQVQAVPWPDDVMVWTNSFFYKNDHATRAKRRLIARYLILCETLVLRNVSTRIRKRFPTIDSLLQAGLITDEELELYERVSVENNRWQLPLQWIINGVIVPAVNDESIPAAGAGSIIAKVNDFRTALRVIYIYDWICIPLVYTQTCSVVVYGYFSFCLIGHQYFGQEADLYIPFLTILQFIFFVGWFKVAQDLMRPFGEDDDDVELNVVLDRHAAVAMNFADELCSLNPIHSWDANGKKSSSPNGSWREDEISYIDGANNDQDDYFDDTNGSNLLFLPYSRAAMKSASHDHAPKLHSLVKIKSPEEEQLVSGPTWIKLTNSSRNSSANGSTVIEKVEVVTIKKDKAARPTNPF